MGRSAVIQNKANRSIVGYWLLAIGYWLFAKRSALAPPSGADESGNIVIPAG